MATHKTFPNIPINAWTNIRAQFKKSIPGTMSNNYLASILGISEGSARTNIVPTLKQIGLVDDDGKTNQELAKKFRDDTAYEKFCDDLIKKIYPQELRDAFPDKDSDRNKILSWFMNHTGVGEAGAKRMVVFYLTLLEADPNSVKTSNTTAQKERKPKATKVEAKAKKIKLEEKREVEEKHSIAPPRHHHAPDVNINIQIHISSDASPDQIKSIFENMAKYIYKD
jgi:hypothetical protein